VFTVHNNNIGVPIMEVSTRKYVQSQSYINIMSKRKQCALKYKCDHTRGFKNNITFTSTVQIVYNYTVGRRGKCMYRYILKQYV